MNLMGIVHTIRDNVLHIRRATGDGLVVMSGLLVMRISAFIISILVARIAGAETLGEYTLFITVFILASEIPHAFDTAYLRASGMQKDSANNDLYAATNAFAKLVLFSIISFVLYLFSEVISDVLNKPVAGEMITWAVLCGGLNSIFMLLPAMAQQRRNFRVVALLKPTFNISALCLILTVVFLGQKIIMERLYDIYFFVGIVLGAVSLVYIFWNGVGFKSKSKEIRTYLGVAATLLISTALAMIGNRLDVFFLGYYLDFEQLGIYGVALRVSVVISVMTAVMSTIMIPRAAAAATDQLKFKRYVQLGFFYSVIQLVFALILLILIEPLIVLVFGGEYVNATFPAALLILQVLILSVGIPYKALIQCGDRPSRLIYISLIRLIFTVPLMMFLVPHYGVSGAAIAITSTTFLVTMIVIVLAVKYRPLQECATEGSKK